MKLCPHCEFIYEEDQSFCDMDGKELVHDPGPFSATENAAPTSPHLHPVVTPVSLASGAPSSLNPGLPASSPSRCQSRSYAIVAVAGVLLAMLLFVVYYARAHRSQSGLGSQDQSRSRVAATLASEPDLGPSSASLAENSPEQSSEQLASAVQTTTVQLSRPDLSPASEKSVTRGRQAPAPVSAGSSTRSNRAAVIIQLTNGASIKADEAWERRDGIWYRQGGVVTFLKRDRVRAIQRPAPSKKGQQTGSPKTMLAQNQPRVGRPEAVSSQKESRVSSFLKKTGRILKKPFKF